MSFSRARPVSVWVIAIAVFAIAACILTADDDRHVGQVSSKEIIKGELGIVGLLGKPLGQVMKLECELIGDEPNSPDAVDRRQLRVTKIDGTDCPEPVEFNFAEVEPFHERDREKLVSGAPFQCRAYEGIATSGHVKNIESDNVTTVIVPARVRLFGARATLVFTIPE